VDLTPAGYAQVRHQHRIVAAGLVGPLLLLPPVALLLIRLFSPTTDIRAGLLLIVACPIGGISNMYSYLAGASTALSMLTGASRPDRFTLATEFATRNVGVATPISVTLAGRVEFAVFATTSVPNAAAAWPLCAGPTRAQCVGPRHPCGRISGPPIW